MPVVGKRPDGREVEAELRSLPRPWIADVGSGGDPWPVANILVDKYPEACIHRNPALRTDGKLFIRADIEALPFADKSLDFVIASHVIEHTENPLDALAELQRVSAKGVAWVPSAMAEGAARTIFPEKNSGHRWVALHDRGQGFIFFRFDEANPAECKTTLAKLYVTGPPVLSGYGTEMRIAWGWGSWPEKIVASIVNLDGQKEAVANGE